MIPSSFPIIAFRLTFLAVATIALVTVIITFTFAVFSINLFLVSRSKSGIKHLVRITAKQQIKLLRLLWPCLLFEGKGLYCQQDKG